MDRLSEYQGYYIDSLGALRKKPTKKHTAVDGLQERRESAVWLRFIVLFWNPRVLKAAVKFGMAAIIMNRYERLGFAVLMLCFAL